jgi:hypothetical protein
MRKENPLIEKLSLMKVKGIPVIIQTNKEREQAFNAARKLEIEISTRRRIGLPGFEVYRVK